MPEPALANVAHAPGLPVPMTLAAALDVDWMSAALALDNPGVRVRSAEASNIHHGVATHVLMNVGYHETGEKPMPAKLFLKGAFEGEGNAHLLAGGSFYREARFYREIVPMLPVSVPDCFYSGFDEVTKQGVLILEDIGSNVERSYGSAPRRVSMRQPPFSRRWRPCTPRAGTPLLDPNSPGCRISRS